VCVGVCVCCVCVCGCVCVCVLCVCACVRAGVSACVRVTCISIRSHLHGGWRAGHLAESLKVLFVCCTATAAATRTTSHLLARRGAVATLFFSGTNYPRTGKAWSSWRRWSWLRGSVRGSCWNLSSASRHNQAHGSPCASQRSTVYMCMCVCVLCVCGIQHTLGFRVRI
jgi:hypothetical protein